MKKSYLLFIVLFFLASCITNPVPRACTTDENPCSPISCSYSVERCKALNEKEMYYCEEDSYCVLISISSCCKYTSVNKDFKDQVEEIPQVCEMYCPFEPGCIDNRCVPINRFQDIGK